MPMSSPKNREEKRERHFREVSRTWEPHRGTDTLLGTVGNQWKASKRCVMTSDVPLYRTFLAGVTAPLNEGRTLEQSRVASRTPG